MLTGREVRERAGRPVRTDWSRLSPQERYRCWSRPPAAPGCWAGAAGPVDGGGRPLASPAILRYIVTARNERCTGRSPYWPLTISETLAGGRPPGNRPAAAPGPLRRRSLLNTIARQEAGRFQGTIVETAVPSALSGVAELQTIAPGRGCSSSHPPENVWAGQQKAPPMPTGGAFSFAPNEPQAAPQPARRGIPLSRPSRSRKAS